MVKFSDIDQNGPDSPHQKSKNDGLESSKNSLLSFRKLATEREKLASEKIVSETFEPDKKEKAHDGGKDLYKKACDYLKGVIRSVKQGKTFPLKPALQIINEMLVSQSSRDTLFLEALHYDDPNEFIVTHHVNVAIYAIKMAEHLGWSRDRQLEIGTAALLHDVGMGLIPDDLLLKQDRFTDAELLIIKERSNYAYKILKTFKEDYAYLAECALHVNERFDGSGYPMGLKGDEINEYAQIIGLIDMYEALIHSRPQREKFLHFTAVKEIIKLGKNIFQKQYLKTLLNIFSIFPIFSYVKLNSNAVGRVTETFPDQPMRPKIKIVFDSQGRRLLTERVINLQENPLLYIVDSVSEEELRGLSNGTISQKATDAS